MDPRGITQSRLATAEEDWSIVTERFVTLDWKTLSNK